MSTEQLILSSISAIFIGGVAGYLGTLMLSKRMALVAGPLGHLTLPGIVLSLIFGFDVSLGAFPFVILGIFFIWLFEQKTKLPFEALTAIVFALGVAISFLFLPMEKAKEALIGDITKVSFSETLSIFILSSFIFFLVSKIYSKLVLIQISEDIAKSKRIKVKLYNFLYLFSVALLVSLGVKMVGSLMTAALVAIPAATSRNLAKNFSQYKILSFLFGAISALCGVLIFKFFKLPAGPLTIIISSSFFLLSSLLK